MHVPLKALREDVAGSENHDIAHIATALRMADVMMANLPPGARYRLVAPMLNVKIPGGAESEGEWGASQKSWCDVEEPVPLQ